MSTIDPTPVDIEAAPRSRKRASPRADANHGETRLATALHELRERREEVADELRTLGLWSPRVLVGMVVGAAVLGGIVLAVRSRRRRGPPRARSMGRRIASELTKEIAGRVLTTAASVMAARLTEEILLPMVRERLESSSERRR